MKYKPYYSKQMSNLMIDSNFLKEHGKLLLSILESNYFWQKLKRRIDFLFYAYVLKQNAGICPNEIDPISADCLFELVEKEILRLNLSYDEIIIDELYRTFVSYVKGEYNPDGNYNYEFFCAPYISSQVYEERPRQGSIYLEQFTKELFLDPLQQMTRQLCNSL